MFFSCVAIINFLCIWGSMKGLGNATQLHVFSSYLPYVLSDCYDGVGVQRAAASPYDGTVRSGCCCCARRLEALADYGHCAVNANYAADRPLSDGADAVRVPEMLPSALAEYESQTVPLCTIMGIMLKHTL